MKYENLSSNFDLPDLFLLFHFQIPEHPSSVFGSDKAPEYWRFQRKVA